MILTAQSTGDGGKSARIPILLVIALSALFVCGGYLAYRANSSESHGSIPAEGQPRAAEPRNVNASPERFQPTIQNRKPPPRLSPNGMVWIPGGEFSMGANDPPAMDEVGMKATEDARPIHRVYVDGFFMDTTDVTNAQFAKFVEATGYVTVAELAPRAEDFPDAPSENLIAGGVVFSPPDHAVPVNDHLQWWSYVKGANWRDPSGPGSDVRDKANYPVVQIAYQDAVAYAKWAGKRLPTEAEWEFAARVALLASRSSGVMNFVPAVNGWRTRTRGTSRTPTPERMDSLGSPR